MIRLALLATLATGCATVADVAYLIGGPQTRAQTPATAHGTGRIDRYREIAIVPREGFVCREIETPYVTRSSITTHARHPNGYRTVMQVFTGLEAGVAALAFGFMELTCANQPEDCVEDREKIYLYSIPLFADIAWGLFRSLTIHNAIVRESRVTGHGDEAPIQGTTLAWSCPIGTAVPLYAGTEQLILHVGEEGRIVIDERDAMLRFVLAHPQFSVGAGFTLDAKGVADLVAFARITLPPPVAAATPPPAPPPPTVEVPAQVCIDTPLLDACVRARTPPPQVRDHR